MTNKDLLYSTGNSTQYSVMAYMGKESRRVGICTRTTHSLCCIPELTQHCKSTIPYKKIFFNCTLISKTYYTLCMSYRKYIKLLYTIYSGGLRFRDFYILYYFIIFNQCELLL